MNKWLLISFLLLGFFTITFANPKPKPDSEDYGMDNGQDDGLDEYDDQDDIENVEDENMEIEEDVAEYRTRHKIGYTFIYKDIKNRKPSIRLLFSSLFFPTEF